MLNYLTSLADLQAAFNRIHANLTDSGHFIFDLISGGKSDQDFQTAVQRIRLPGVLSTWTATLWPRRRESVVQMLFVFRGRDKVIRKTREVHRQRWYPINLICQLLKNSDFVIRGLHGGETLEPATAATFWVKFIVRKKHDRHLPNQVAA